jgi:hypothetical protein
LSFFFVFEELLMPTSIPVQVGQQQFSSMNQARLYYREILYRYNTGQTLGPADRYEVVSLLTSAATGLRPPSSEDAVSVVKGSFGRKCFAVRPEKESEYVMSVLKAIRECAGKLSATGQSIGTEVGTIEWCKQDEKPAKQHKR